MQAPENFLVLHKDVFSVELGEIFFIRPAVHRVCARNSPRDVLIPEAGDARHDNIRVYHSTLFACPRFRLQR